MLLDDTHKLELLKIVEQHPSDIALLSDQYNLLYRIRL